MSLTSVNGQIFSPCLDLIHQLSPVVVEYIESVGDDLNDIDNILVVAFHLDDVFDGTW